MSIAVMSAVWNLDLQSTDKLILLAFADYANDDGRCFPSTDIIAHKSGVSRRHAVRVVKDLIERGLLIVEEAGGGRGNRRVVRVCPEKGDTLSRFRPREKGDTTSLNSAETVTPCPKKGDTTSPEPLEEPSGTSTDSSLRSESDADGASDRMKANELVAAWVDLQPLPPSDYHKGKQGAVAKRLCEQYPAEAIHHAANGMTKLFPHSKGGPWDLFDFERKFSKALQAELNGSEPPDEWAKYLPEEET